ncbi:MAG: branched-chain amino acid ABC transporter permease [Caldilineaceae bacterium]|nr:branched-chain amino acid ABC transporter permease [Caldilineaceae bacterium]
MSHATQPYSPTQIDRSSRTLPLWAKAGLLAGLAIVYTGAVGMIEAFSQREVITDTLTLGQILIFLPLIVAGYFVAERTGKTHGVAARLGYGLLSGSAAFLLPLLLIMLAQLINLRAMFVNISPALINLLTLEQGLATGLGLLLVGFIGCGFIGAFLNVLPNLLSKALINGIGWVLGVGLLAEYVIQIIQPWFGRAVVRQLFASKAINPIPALYVFCIAVVIGLLWNWQQHTIKRGYSGMGQGPQRVVQSSGLALLMAFLLVLPWLVGTFLSEVMVNVGLFVLMGLGLNIAIGLAGLLDLGYVTNYAVGAYLMGVLTSTGQLGQGELSFWIVLPLCVLAAMFTGFFFALPVLRMRGDYLAIATLGFGEIIRVLALSDWLRPVIGGAQGILQIPKPNFFGIVLGGPQQIYYLVLGACLLTLFVMIRLNNSRTGRQWMAIREDEDAAAAMGIDPLRTKVLAFTLSAATGGLAGGILAIKLGTIFPTTFNLLVSVNALSVIIIGGMGSIPGIVVGALALVGLPELLREFSDFRLLLYGALLIVMMLVRPEGLWPSAVRRRELHEEESLGDHTPTRAAEADEPVTVGG